MLRLVSYRSDRTAPTWHAGVASHHALIDLAGYAAAPLRGQAGATYPSVRAFLAASPGEQAQILAWAARQFDAGEQVLSLDEVELGPPVPDPEKILCLGLNYPEHAAEAGSIFRQSPPFLPNFATAWLAPPARSSCPLPVTSSTTRANWSW